MGDELDSLSLEELAALVEIEESDLDELESSELQLAQWQQRVDDFGGRFGSPQQRSLKNQISSAQLGQRVRFNTTSAIPTFPESVVLAEMALKQPIAVDVVFATNAQGLGTPGITSLDIGDGFVQVTWGTTGAFTSRIKVDAGQGWVHTFTAAFLRVEYIPIDLGFYGHFPLPGGQSRDLEVGASIVPARGGRANTILTKTYQMPTGVIVAGEVPAFARTVQVTVVPTPTVFSTPSWNLTLVDSASTAVASWQSTGATIEYPAWQGLSYRYPIPQRAVRSGFFAPGGVQSYLTPSLVYELSI